MEIEDLHRAQELVEEAEQYLVLKNYSSAETLSLKALDLLSSSSSSSQNQKSSHTILNDRAASVFIQCAYETNRFSMARPCLCKQFKTIESSPPNTLLLWLSLALDTDELNTAHTLTLHLLQNKANARSQGWTRRQYLALLHLYVLEMLLPALRDPSEVCLWLQRQSFLPLDPRECQFLIDEVNSHVYNSNQNQDSANSSFANIFGSGNNNSRHPPRLLTRAAHHDTNNNHLLHHHSNNNNNNNNNNSATATKYPSRIHTTAGTGGVPTDNNNNNNNTTLPSMHFLQTVGSGGMDTAHSLNAPPQSFPYDDDIEHDVCSLPGGVAVGPDFHAISSAPGSPDRSRRSLDGNNNNHHSNNNNNGLSSVENSPLPLRTTAATHAYYTTASASTDTTTNASATAAAAPPPPPHLHFLSSPRLSTSSSLIANQRDVVYDLDLLGRVQQKTFDFMGSVYTTVLSLGHALTGNNNSTTSGVVSMTDSPPSPSKHTQSDTTSASKESKNTNRGGGGGRLVRGSSSRPLSPGPSRTASSNINNKESKNTVNDNTSGHTTALAGLGLLFVAYAVYSKRSALKKRIYTAMVYAVHGLNDIAFMGLQLTPNPMVAHRR